MQIQHFRRHWRLAVLSVLLVVGQGAAVAAESASSTNYRVDGAQFGAGAAQSCSGEYCANASVGDTFTGNTSSANYRVTFSANPEREPQIQVITIAGTQNLGVLDVDRTATASTTVKIRDYYSTGYTMQLVGSTPTQGVHAITPITAPSTSHPGAEQFGINLVANTEPPIGKDPIYVSGDKDDDSRGQPEADYSVPNIFKYVDGDTIATSLSRNSETHYTISMIMNVANETPVGRYAGTFNIIVVPAY